MRILITGNLGYLGTVLAPALAANGHAVTGLDSDLFGGCQLSPLPPVPTRRLDIRDVEAPDLEGVEVIVHLAALSNDPLGELDPALTDEVNRAAAIRLGELARESGVRRFVFASTCSVYGAGGETPLGEGAPCRPLTPYAEAKLAAERGLIGLSGPGFAVTVLRMATAYGASPMIRFDLVLNNLVAWAATTGEVRLKSDGAAWRPLAHVEDLACAIAAVIDEPEGAPAGRILNVGVPGHNHRVRAIARTVERVVSGARISIAEDAAADDRSYRVDFERVAALPGFEPRWDLHRGAVEVLGAIERHRLLVEDFEGARYDRLHHIVGLREAGALDDGLRWTRSGSPVG
jgi:nucleoside-diphosphate-sugar epimerase